MHRLAILFCAMAPSMVLLQYGIAKARARWDDGLIWEAFFTGGIASVFMILPELLLKKMFAVGAMTSVHGAGIEALFIAAVPEEIAKLGALFFTIKRYGDGADRHDMIMLAFAVALGFAAIENVAYLVAARDWQHLAIGRGLLAVPMHGLTGLVIGAFLTAAHLHPRSRRLYLTAALGIPILLHAGYDFPLLLVRRNEALFGVLPAWFVIFIIVAICVLCLCNATRAATDRRAHRSPDVLVGGYSPRLVGVAILLATILLAALTLLLLDSRSGMVVAGVLGILPAILGIDLLWSGARPAVSPTVSAFRTGYED
jgi:protease PrsW